MKRTNHTASPPRGSVRADEVLPLEVLRQRFGIGDKGVASIKPPNHHHTTTTALPYVGQPTLPAVAYPNMLDKLPPGIGAYLAACERRGLYQAVADRLGMPREDAKPRVMAVFFGRPHHRTRASRALEMLFPEAWQAIQALKRKHGYTSLAHAAQRAESSFIFGRCVRRLMAEHPGLWLGTIHDSILTADPAGAHTPTARASGHPPHYVGGPAMTAHKSPPREQRELNEHRRRVRDLLSGMME